MDVQGLFSSQYYQDFLKTNTDTSATKMKANVGALGEDATDEELMGVCKQFESYLLEQVFKEMEKTVTFGDDDEKTVSVPGLGGGSTGNALIDYFKDQTISQITEDATKRGEGLGLAQKLYESMKRN